MRSVFRYSFGILAFLLLGAQTYATDSINPGFINSDIISLDSGTPIGTIIAWNSYEEPDNGQWLKCDGRVVSGSEYPTYVAKFGGTTPDFRGKFLRGLGGNSLNLNEVQAEAVKSNSGSSVVGSFASGDLIYGATGCFYAVNEGGGGGNSNGKDGGTRPRVYLNLGNIMPFGNEVRPTNLAVVYYIKVN